MKTQIRKSVFETNSSSSHSLTLGKGDLVKQPFSKKQLRDGIINLTVADYHWEWHRYYSTENKLRYLLTQVTNGKIPSGDSERVTRELCEDNERVRLLCDVVREHTGCIVLLHGSSGGIDHQSAMAEKGAGLELFNNAQTLREFLFNAESYIETGNDNSAAPWEIETDRGRERSYESHIQEVPQDYVAVELQPLSRNRSEGFATAAGGIVTPGDTPQVHTRLLAFGIVASAAWKTGGGFNIFEHRDIRGHSAQEAARYNGFKVSPHFWASHAYKRSDDFRDEEVTFKTFVPEELARELAELSPLGKVQFDLKTARKEVTYWRKRMTEREDDKWTIKQLAKAEQLVVGLTNELMRRERKLAPKKPSAKKVVAVKTVSAKKPAAKIAVKKSKAQ